MGGCPLTLFYKSMGEYHRIIYKETKYAISIGAKLDSALPYLFGANKLLEIRRWNHLQIFQ